MKKIISQKSIVITLLLHFAAVLAACNSSQMREYYSNKDNFINATGIVTYISYNENRDSLYFEFSELTPEFDDSCFKIVGDNLYIVKEKGIDYKINIGDQITFITAPEYFGDGYVMPIVAISVEGEELLTFEEGFDNLQEWLN